MPQWKPVLPVVYTCTVKTGPTKWNSEPKVMGQQLYTGSCVLWKIWVLQNLYRACSIYFVLSIFADTCCYYQETRNYNQWYENEYYRGKGLQKYTLLELFKKDFLAPSGYLSLSAQGLLSVLHKIRGVGEWGRSGVLSYWHLALSRLYHQRRGKRKRYKRGNRVNSWDHVSGGQGSIEHPGCCVWWWGNW